MSDDDIYFDTPESAPSLPNTQRTVDAKKAREMRDSPQFKALRDRFREECARNNAPCHLCGSDINYQLRYPHPFSWSADHLITVKENPALLMDRNNLRASHFDCNINRGTDAVSCDIGIGSEIW